METTTLVLNAEQYETLLKLVFTGNWINENNDSLTADVIQKVCEAAKNVEKEDLVQVDPDTNNLMPSDDLFGQLLDQMVVYEEEVFWDSMIHRMSERDKIAELGMENFEQLSVEERMEVIEPIYEHYEKEFSEHGIDRLFIKE